MAVFEQPLNERIRLFMRLSYLMKRFNYHLEDATPENCQVAVVILLELYNLSSRLDVKNAVLHVLDFQTQAVRQAKGADGVNDIQVTRILTKLENNSKKLYSFRGQLGQHLKTHSFLNIIRQRSTIAGGINGLDIPLFNHWLNQPNEKRTRDLRDWAKPYEIAFDAIELLMELFYQSGETQEITAEGGFYQSSLSYDRDYQIMSIELPDDSKVYPEISAGKQRFSVRFVDATMLEERGKQIIDNIYFKLTLYSF